MTLFRVLITILCVFSFSAYSRTSTLPYELVINDPADLLGTDRDGVISNIDAAMDDWGKWITSKGTIRIHVEVTNDTSASSGRFGGTSTTNRFDTDWNGYKLFEDASIYKMRTGKEVKNSRSEITVYVNPTFMRQAYWIDPKPQERTTPVPLGKVDLVTVFAHEIGHGFGINGFLKVSDGSVRPSMALTPYDKFILDTSMLGENNVYFKGPLTRKANGDKDLPIFFVTADGQEVVEHNGHAYICNKTSSQNLFHYGHFETSSPSDDKVFFGLMSGSWLSKDKNQGQRTFVSAIDAAILGDLGIPLLNSKP